MMANKSKFDEVKSALIEASGDSLRTSVILGVTRTSVYNYLARYPELKALANQLQETVEDYEADDSPLADDPDDAPILTAKQVEAIEFIDKESNKGELWAYVNSISTSVLLKLEQRGFITLRYEEGGKYAMLTDNGEIALLWHVKKGSREWEMIMAGKGKPVRKKASAKNGQADLKQYIKPFGEDETSEQPVNQVIGQEPPSPAFPPQAEEGSKEDCGDCAECLHRDVLDYLMQQNPDVKELYEHVAAMKASEKKAQAVLKKFGGG